MAIAQHRLNDHERRLALHYKEIVAIRKLLAERIRKETVALNRRSRSDDYHASAGGSNRPHGAGGRGVSSAPNAARPVLGVAGGR
jgi:hypothetical protein